jgi:NADH oxidase (H2O2-forming)
LINMQTPLHPIQRVVIIGNGIAGNSASEAIRKFDKSVDITLVSDEDTPLYSPCAFHKYLSGEMEKHKLLIKKLADYTREGIRVLFGEKITEVDLQSKNIFIENKSIAFDKLIFATGSRAILPPLKGINKTGVFSLKTLSDAENIFSRQSSTVVVVGSGPIGLEAAIALKKRGLTVYLIEILNRILPRLFDDANARLLRQILEQHGLKVLTGERVTEILGDNSVKGLQTDRRQIDCDTVIMAAGVRPESELAKKAGLILSAGGSIPVDEHMQVNVEDVYACGDCVAARDIISGNNTVSMLWHNARRQGIVAGFNCLGYRKKFTGSFDATSIDIFGNYALSLGKNSSSFHSPDEYDVIEKISDSASYRFVIVDNRVVGAQLINQTERVGSLASVMWRKEDFIRGLAEISLDKKLLLAKPWRYWMQNYAV